MNGEATPRLRKLLAESTNGGNWRVRRGLPADHFAPDGYRYVQFGPTERAADGFGTDQMAPADAALIVAAVDFLRAALDPSPPAEERKP